jgi:putative ABC transport system permease protein
MNIFETIRIALIALASNKLRTVLTMLGVIIGVGSVVTLLSIGTGVSEFMTGRVTALGTNLLTLQPENRVPNARLTMADVEALSNPLDLPGALRVVPIVQGQARVSIGINQRNTSVQGTTADFFATRGFVMAQGDIFSDEDNDLRMRNAVLGSAIAETLFGANAAAVGNTVIINAAPFRVVGVAEPKGGFGPGGNIDDTVYVPLTVAQEKLFVGRGTGLRSVSQIVVELKSTEEGAGAKEDITAVLRKNHNLLAGQADDFRIQDQAEFLSTLTGITTALSIFLGSVGAISLLVGGIGIMNIMLVSVTERTREIGLRKAIGAKRGTILTQFMIESLVVSVIAGLVGVAFGTGISTLAGPYIAQALGGTFRPVTDPATVGIAFGFAALIGLVFGIYPAWRASRLMPVVALRYE